MDKQLNAPMFSEPQPAQKTPNEKIFNIDLLKEIENVIKKKAKKLKKDTI